MMPTALTLDGLDCILAFRPLLGPEVPRAEAYHEIREDMVVLHPDTDHVIDAFVHTCYETGFIDFFDWPTWIDGPGQAFSTSDGLMGASLLDCQRILTVIIRQDRFCEGSLISLAKNGFLAALLDRLAHHRRQFDKGNGLPYPVLNRQHLIGLNWCQPCLHGEATPMTETWATLAEVAAHLQVAEETVHRWIRRKGMPATRAGRNWRFKISQVDAWLEAGGAAPKPGDDEESGVHGPH